MFCEIVISKCLRLDKGTETGVMATIHSMIWSITNETAHAEETVRFGPSTNNKVCLIEISTRYCSLHHTSNAI